MVNNPIAHPDFLLDTSAAKELYHQCAAHLPVVDYHNHLSPALIAQNHRFSSIAELWLEGDHYKWRALRALGVDEYFLTGNASDYEKFYTWCKNLPFLIGNPLYHWSHLELDRYFGIQTLISEKTADFIYQSVNQILQSTQVTTHAIFDRFKLKVCCTTDDPCDTLEHHVALQEGDQEFVLLPGFRPDNALIFKGHEVFKTYLERLSHAAGMPIHSLDDLKEALVKRIDFFDALGCKTADHGLHYVPSKPQNEALAETSFQKMLHGKAVSLEEMEAYVYHMLIFLAEQYAKKGWVQQFHLGAKRNNNERAFLTLGPDKGYDSIGGFNQVNALNDFFNELEKKEALTKTIIYNLNPTDSAAFAATCGNFHRKGVKGFIQWGAPWWFLDQRHHIEEYFNILSNISVLSVSIGMLTDSRSFMSLPRHEYYRRLLCRTLGRWIAEGLIANDKETNQQIVADICFNNVVNFFGFKIKNSANGS